MEQLKDLGLIYSHAADKFRQYDGKDFVLPSEFKEQVKEINNNVISYNKYSAVIITKGNLRGALNIYMPNQWFYIASYFTDYYKELIKYRNLALKVTSKERLKTLDNGTLTEQEEDKINSLELDEESRALLKRFISDYSWWHGAKTIDRADFYVSPILTCAGLVNASQSFVAELCAFLADKNELTNAVIKGAETEHIMDSIFNAPKELWNLPLQQIYYGAPGTGKSYEIKKVTKMYSVIRTTFHPDSDYSTFVGAYKPVMSQVDLRDVSGHVVIEDGKRLKEERITYKYVKQAFLKAYLGAWQKYVEDGKWNVQFLIIEEINRGNCAQIFGDLFQLLDRNDYGFSTYPIEADTDLHTEIKKAFGKGGEYELKCKKAENGKEFIFVGLTEDIKEGRILCLPPNLYIWATMNTSDQSLFPIDSAFKRRWNWRYVKIKDAGKGWKIIFGNEYCDWWTFIEEINKKIAKETSSDDKKLGYFFCKAKDGVITADKFVSKVLFYLWNDVFKDGDIALFKVSDEPEAEICYDAFYGSDNKVNIEAIRAFLVGVVGEENIKTNDDAPIAVDVGDNGNSIDYTKYSFDGKSRLSKKDLGYNIVMKYINEHSDKTFAELQSDLAFDDTVDNKYRYKGVLARTEEITGSYTPCFGAEQISSDGVKYKVLTWWNKYNIDFIIKFAKAQGWTVNTVTE